MSDTAAQPWPEVTSPVARRVLDQLAGYLDCFTDDLLLDHLEELEQDLRMRGFGELWQKLCASSLAEQLAAGPGSLPDISRALPWPYAQFQRWLRPGGLEGQVVLLIRHLDWYVCPRERAPVPKEVLTFGVLGITATACTLGSTIARWVTAGSGSGALAWMDAVPLSMMLLVLMAFGCAIWQALTPRRPRNRGFSPSMRNVTALFHYLRWAYADPVEPGPIAGSASVSAATENELAAADLVSAQRAGTSSASTGNRLLTTGNGYRVGPRPS